MTICLGLMFHQGDLPFLRLHIPYLRQGFEHIMAGSDDTSSEAAEFLRGCGAEVVPVPFNDHWSESLNALIDAATGRYDKMIRLDPDELIFVEDIPRIEAGLDRARMLITARYNFWFSRETMDIGAFPDFQCRMWRLDGNVRYQGKRHEGLVSGPGDMVMLPGVYLYHYGDASTTGYMHKALKYFNYARRDTGQPLVDKLPDDVYPGANVAIFAGAQPLDPAVVGKTAPFDE